MNHRIPALTLAGYTLMTLACAPDTAPPESTTLRMRVDRETGEREPSFFGGETFEVESVDPDSVVAWVGWVGIDDVAVITAGPFGAEEMVIGGAEVTGLDAPLGTPADDVVVDSVALGFVLVIGADVDIPAAGSLADFAAADVEFDVASPEFRVAISEAERSEGYVEGLNSEGNEWIFLRTGNESDQRFVRP